MVQGNDELEVTKALIQSLQLIQRDVVVLVIIENMREVRLIIINRSIGPTLISNHREEDLSPQYQEERGVEKGNKEGEHEKEGDNALSHDTDVTFHQ